MTMIPRNLNPEDPIDITQVPDEELTNEYQRRAKAADEIRKNERYEKYKKNVADHDARFLALAHEVLPELTQDQFEHLACLAQKYWEEYP